MLSRSHPETAERLMAEAQKEADRRYQGYLAQAQVGQPKTGD